MPRRRARPDPTLEQSLEPTQSSWRRANDRHPFVDAEDVHGGPDSPRDPLIDRLRQLGPLHCRGTGGYLSNKISILSASAACSHSSTGSERTSGRETGCNEIDEEPFVRGCGYQRSTTR